MSNKYWQKPITLRLTAYQRKILSEIVDGALDAGACKDGLTKLESNALSSIFSRLIGASVAQTEIDDAPPSSAQDGMREALKVARRMIQGELIENAVVDAQSMQSLGDMIDKALSVLPLEQDGSSS